EVGRQLAKHITTLSNGSTKTLEITAVEPDPGEAVKLANAFAEALVAEITGREAQRYNQSRDQIIQTLDSLQSQIAQLDTQLKGNPPNSSVVTAQRNGLVNQYQVVYANFQQLASTGTPTSLLSTLELAQALPISASEYEARLQLGELGTNHLHTGDSTATMLATMGRSGTSLTGPVSRSALGALLGL